MGTTELLLTGLFRCFVFIAFIRRNFAQVSPSVNLPNVLWDPRNYLFSCDPTINIRVNDVLKITCPNRSLNTKALEKDPPLSQLNENVYLLGPDQKAEFNACDASKGKLIDYCVADSNLGSTELTIRTSAPGEGTPVFIPGKKYYLIGTGDGTVAGLNNKKGGRCLGSGTPGFYRLRLTIYVCTDLEVSVYRNCSSCQTASCFERGCGTYGDWKAADNYMWNGTSCLQKETRSCSSDLFQCGSGPYQRYVPASKNDLCTLYKVPCSTSSVAVPSPSTVPTTVTTTLATTITESCSCSIPVTTETSEIHSTFTDTSTVTETVTSTVNQTVTETLVSTSISMSVSLSTSVSTSVTTSTEKVVSTTTVAKTTLTSTATVTTTKSTSCDPSKICSSVITPFTSAPVVQYVDIRSKKFYITVISAILGAILVGIFVTHACATYYRANRKIPNTVQVAPYRPPENGSSSKNEDAAQS